MPCARWRRSLACRGSRCCARSSPKNDYRFGLSMEFADRDAYRGYDEHPIHIAFVRERWTTEVETFLEIDVEPL